MEADTTVTAEVGKQLSAPGIRVAARKQWPSGISVRGKIKGLGEGRALGRLNDIGRGPALRELLDSGNFTEDPWMKRIIAVLADWDWATRPVNVAALGSTDPDKTALIEQVAGAIAQAGRMNFAGTLPVGAGAMEVTAQNSAYRVAALLDHWDWSQGLNLVDGGPVLLVTDLIDTGWSVTVAGNGIAERSGLDVLPFALASRG